MFFLGYLNFALTVQKTMFTMLILYLLSIQLAVSYGDLMCMYQKYPKCYIPSIKRKDADYCIGVPQTLKCMKEEAFKCHVQDLREVADMEMRLHDTCQKGTQLNGVYLKHRTCVFDDAMKAAKPCYAKFFGALDKFKSTGNATQDELILFNVSCSYMEEVFQCVKSTVAEKCGDEAKDFYHKLFFPGNDLMEKACPQYSAAAFNFSWTLLLLLQAAAVVFTLKVSSLYEYFTLI